MLGTRRLFDMVLGNIPMTAGRLQQFLQPRLTVSYGFAGDWRAKVSYGVYTQDLITITNEDDLISLFDAWIYLPDELRPEEARHYVAGIEGRLAPRLSTSLQVYLKDYRAIALYNPDKIFAEDPDYINGTGKSTLIRIMAGEEKERIGKQPVVSEVDIFIARLDVHARLLMEEGKKVIQVTEFVTANELASMMNVNVSPVARWVWKECSAPALKLPPPG